MSDYKSMDAEQNWEKFIDIFNRSTIFAPYTVPLSQDLVDHHIIPYMRTNKSTARIGENDAGEGILHAGTYTIADVSVGHIFLFLAENNDVANRLLAEAEEWFAAHGISRIFAFSWFPSPYNFILHGRETYAWAGAFPPNNAFRRRGYDLLNDIVVMQLKINEAPPLSIPPIPGLELRRVELGDTKLAWSARVEAYVDQRKIGHCEFYELKAISSYFKKPIGQITIDTDREFYGEGVAKCLITYAHQVLFQRGSRYVMLATGQSLFRAIKFYEKLGYEAECIKAYSYIKEYLTL